MSEERTGEVAASSSPPSAQQAHIGGHDQALRTDHSESSASQQIQTGESNIPASASERDVEALTAVQDSNETNTEAGSQQNASATGLVSSASSTQLAGAHAKKFTSLNVNKRFLEKAGPTTSIASPASLKLGTSVSPRPSNRLSSPSTSTRLTSAKLSSVPKPQPAGWATTKPSTPTAKPHALPQSSATAAAPPAAAAAAAVPAVETLPATTAASAGPLPAEASVPAPKAALSPKPTNSPVPVHSSAAVSTAGAAASPRLVSMGRDSPRPGSSGLDSSSASGRASPGLKNAALGSSLRAASPGNLSRAPWAGVKSSLSSNPASATRGSTLSDFPTAAEAAKAKQEQEEKAAAAAAKEAARQQAALQALDRFRGTSLGSGKHWDEMEDDGFLDEVVEFGDGTQYKVPTSGHTDDGPPVTKEERFKDVGHDRSWPPRNSAKPAPSPPNDRSRPAPTQPAAWGPMKNRDMASSGAGEAAVTTAQTTSRPSRSEIRAEKVIIPTTGASVSLRSPVESRETSYSYGRERRSGPASSFNGRQEHGAPAPAVQAASTQAVRAWGPLAQRQASLNPGAAPPAALAKPTPSAEPAAPPAVATAPPALEPIRPTAQVQSTHQQQQHHQQHHQQQEHRTIERSAISSRQPSAPAGSAPVANGRPLPPHLLVAGSVDGRPAAAANRPLPPHLAQNLRPAAADQLTDSVERKASQAYDETRRPPAAVRPAEGHEQNGHQSQPPPIAAPVRSDGSTRPPWGPKAMAQGRGHPDAGTARDSIPATQASNQLPPSGKEEDVHAAIERARKRRQEEEKARLAEKERARQKAMAIEERLRAAEQQREAEAQRAAQKRAAEAAVAVAANAAGTVEAPSARKPGPADSAASWRQARVHDASNAAQSGNRPQQASATATIQSDPPAHANTADRAGGMPPSRFEQQPGGERLAPRPEQNNVQQRGEARQRDTDAAQMTNRARVSPTQERARLENATAKEAQSDAPKTILTRPLKQASTAIPTDARANGPASSDFASDHRTQRNSTLLADRHSSKVGLSPRPREAVTQEKGARSTAPIKVATPVEPPALVSSYPVVPKEASETRIEAPQDAPPAWNRFVVHLKGSRIRPKLNRFQQKQLAAKVAAMKAPGRAVYPLTWDPPLSHLSFKTLSRDDQLFPKRYHRGTVIAPVRLPARAFARGLPSIVPQIVSQVAGNGLRKQARFDLPPQWSDGQRGGEPGSDLAADASAAHLSTGAQIQVRLPGHHATVVHPSAVGYGSDGMQVAESAANRRSNQVDATTDAIIGEVLSSGTSTAAFDERSRAFHAGAPPGSLGPLDYPQNGYSSDAFGAQNVSTSYRNKGRRGSSAAVAFFDDRRVSTPSPVSFMVNSEIKADAVGAGGSLSPFGIPGSTRPSQTQTPASGGSMLPSPSLSTQGTWGQSSLTFPVLETRSSNLADRDHIKNVWSLASNSHTGELQNSLKDIGDDFLPSTIPMSVHDFRADESQLGRTQEQGDSWNPSGSSAFTRYQNYGRAPHDVTLNSRDLSPVANRSNGFDPTSRSPSLGLDTIAPAAARAREAGQQQSQQASSSYSSMNGGAYGGHRTSSYSPRERQHDGSSGLGQGTFGAYGGYTGSASNNVSSMTTDTLYGMSNYSGGSMTPNRQSYGQYTSHASAARSAPGSPYSGMSRHTSNLTSGMSGYSLFPSSGSGNSGARSSQASNGMDGLGVLDDSTFGSNRNQFYGARGYQQSSSAYSASHQGQQGSSAGKWSSSGTAAGGTSGTSASATGSVLRPAASVFNPTQKYTAASQQAAQSQSQGQQARIHHHHQQHQQQEQEDGPNTFDPTGGNSSGPIDSSSYGAGAYGGFSSNAGLW